MVEYGWFYRWKLEPITPKRHSLYSTFSTIIVVSTGESCADTVGLDISTQDLESHLASEIGGCMPSYSGVITDSLVHLESLNQCFSWTTTEELEAQLSHVP
jgi:hypothetical protein